METIADDVTVTLMLAMERLSPLERTAFLLHDIFEVPLKDVAVTLEREPAAVRQLASRARRNLKLERTRHALGAAEADRLARAFFEAAHGGDTATLARLLAQDVEIHADGGGKVSAFRNIVRGAENAIRLFTHVSGKDKHRPTLVRTAIIDGLPGYISLNPDGRVQTTALDVEGGVSGRSTSSAILTNSRTSHWDDLRKGRGLAACGHGRGREKRSFTHSRTKGRTRPIADLIDVRFRPAGTMSAIRHEAND